MRLKTVFVRFYKSFNFDYLRKHHVDAKAHPWEHVEPQLWYPHVRIPIDPKVTTVVGANESGKTHLLTAIEKGITGQGVERRDFCRYSQFFAVEHGKMRLPDFGFEWADLSDEERKKIDATFGIQNSTRYEAISMFRTNGSALTAYIADGSTFRSFPAKDDASSLQEVLPRVLRIDAEIGLPESAPIRALAAQPGDESGLEKIGRQNRYHLFESFFGHSEWFKTKETVAQSADHIQKAVGEYLSPKDEAAADALKRREGELKLARDLICRVANIDPAALDELYKALRDEKDAYVNGLIHKINEALAARLNFPHWWVQDKDFRLVVSPREYDLVFTICDRTGTEYSFAERSSGLRYFLSYYIQYLAYQPAKGRRDILLMDEPDAYLSTQGQQDLMKIFDAFSDPMKAEQPVQVIYVTHSPFLIDKNHSERIRVLEKGVGDEGTRVVRDTAKNHYEPLRSAFGAFVGETTFIGNCNIMVEGPADQILLAGAARYLRNRGAPELETLDLNHVTIVPAGSASHIPYLTYLARGRDIEKPSVVVMLDSDKQGNEAKQGLLRGGPKRRQLLPEHFILQVGDLKAEAGSLGLADGQTLVEIEDLIPALICQEAARSYLRELGGVEDTALQGITAAAISEKIAAGKATFDAIQECVSAVGENGLHIEKVGFAREVIVVVESLADRGSGLSDTEGDALRAFENSMKALFRRLGSMQRQADRERGLERVSRKVERIKDSFLKDNPHAARREQALLVLEDVETALDNTLESDQVRIGVQKIRRDFKLEQEVTKPVENYAEFREQLEGLKYAGRLAVQEPSGSGAQIDLPSSDDQATVSPAETPASKSAEAPALPQTTPDQVDRATTPQESL